jgi:3-oxoadipate enol-lactonase
MTANQALSNTTVLERAGFRVISFDARGHGRSEPAADPRQYGYDVLTEDLGAVMDAFGIERAVLAGISMGAHTALRLALEQPHRSAALAVVSPAFDPEDHPNEENVTEADALAAGVRERGVDGFMAALWIRAGSSREPAGVRAAHSLLRRRLREHHDLIAVGDAVKANLRAKPFDDFGALSALEGPVLVVGTRDELDPRHPYELARSYVRAIPGSRFECERPGGVPLGWGGRKLILLVRELAARAEWGAASSTAGGRRA